MRKVKKGKFAGKEFRLPTWRSRKVLELPPVAKAAAAKTGAKKNTNGSGKPAAAPAVDDTTRSRLTSSSPTCWRRPRQHGEGGGH